MRLDLADLDRLNEKQNRSTILSHLLITRTLILLALVSLISNSLLLIFLMLILTVLALIFLISSLALRCFYCIMSQQQNYTHENHVSTANRIRVVSRIATQTCRVCKLSNRSCYVIAAMSDKCASCAETDKIIKHCEITSSNYINNQNTSLNHVIVSSLNLSDDVFIHLSLNLLKNTYALNSIRQSVNIFVSNISSSLIVFIH
jgi:hypothetical protein